ncbi:hypothetical protein T492DRAFT_596093 [Pavlovales sp. CCMP2436]|nr:hypothetical protein T492DRAFT_596093 [Pavlovales sp. CCMP2436]
MSAALLLLASAGARAGDGTPSQEPCLATCSGSGQSRECSFHVRLDIFASDTGYYVIDECGDTPQPVIAMERNVPYKFFQNDETNWMHPLGLAYFPDGAHRNVDELEPGISQTGGSCVADESCQAPQYSHGAIALSTVDGGFGLDAYEPAFQLGRADWIASRFESGAAGYYVELKITDDQYDKDLFYFCHVHHGMSGRIKQLDAGGARVQTADEPAIPYAYKMPTSFDKNCGTYGLGEYSSNKVCPADTFLCGLGDADLSASTQHFGECLHAMDCAMHEEMRVNLHENDPITTFMHQMVPHHENAVNMAKAILKMDILTLEQDPEGELVAFFWDIVNKQNQQITFMEKWLLDQGRPLHADVYCKEKCPPGCKSSIGHSAQHSHRLLFASFSSKCPSGCTVAY